MISLRMSFGKLLRGKTGLCQPFLDRQVTRYCRLVLNHDVLALDIYHHMLHAVKFSERTLNGLRAPSAMNCGAVRLKSV